MKIQLSVVILAMTSNEELYKMTSHCIESFLANTPDISFEIIVVESNKKYADSEFIYPDFVKIIIPDSHFNFHKFLNIGIRESQGEYIALCNNDLIFHENWFAEILKVAERNPSIKSFSPNGTTSVLGSEQDFAIGHKVQTHVKGWCLVVESQVFQTIKYLDETFDFYYADNDYAMSLKTHNIKHAIVYKSYVEHLEKKSSDVLSDASNQKFDFVKKYRIPDYLFKDHFARILQNEKALSGFLKFYGKWGSPTSVYRKDKISKILFRFNLGYFAKFLYQPKSYSSIYKES